MENNERPMNHGKEQDTEALGRLRERVEQVVGRKMQTPKDFDYLSERIFEKSHQNISSTTLKRLWGYLSEPVLPRISTLNLLAQFVGSESWDAFCQEEISVASPCSDEQGHDSLSVGKAKGKSSGLYILFLLLLITCVIVYFLLPAFKPNIITFADPAVKSLCLAHWDTNGDGELSYEEAAQVTDLKDVFQGDTTIISFDELQHFTGLEAIEECAFSDCGNLISVVLPRQLKSICPYAFQHCVKLASLTIPDSVTRIDLYAFLDCQSLTELHIPPSVTHIGGAAFHGTPKVTTITVDERNPIYDSRRGCNAIIETAANKLVAGCCTTIIPADVTVIGNEAWGGCSSLKSIQLPASIIRIEHGAFSWAYSLNAVVSKIKVPFPFEEGAFNHIGGECTLTVPHGTRDAYIAAGWTEDIFKGGIIEANE